MPDTLQEISTWAAKLPFWEQLALDKIVGGTKLTDADYDECLQYLLAEAELVPQPGAHPVLALPQLAQSRAISAGQTIQLSKLSHLRNINALRPDQTVTFGSQLTLIYGANGSGKSGYARLLASAAFTRGDKQILRDINQPLNPAEEMSAEIEVIEGGVARQIHYEVGVPLVELSNFYVFDSTSVHAHLTKLQEFSFSPVGLSYLALLADATEEVRSRLAKLVETKKRSNPFTAFFQGITRVSVAVANLGATSDLNELRQLATLSSFELAKLNQFDHNIADLKANGVEKQIEDLEQKIIDLGLLQAWIRELVATLDDSACETVATDVRAWIAENALAERMNTEQFREATLRQVGTPAWRSFVAAAEVLARAESTLEAPYPQPDDICLLCHQHLSTGALELIRRLWDTLQSQAQATSVRLRETLNRHDERLSRLSFDPWNDQHVAYRQLVQVDPGSFDDVHAFVESCNERRAALLSGLKSRVMAPWPTLLASPAAHLETVVASLKDRCASLRQQDPQAQIASLQQQKAELDQRVLLAEKLPEIEAYVADLRWIKTATDNKVMRSTGPITRKHNELFKALVTDRYLLLFQANLEKLHCPLRVEVRTKGLRGQTLKQLVLKADPSMAKVAEPDKVLSEGEQRAVALADFLTEAELDSNCAGLIFDDPVTSLDFQWKDVIAAYVAHEAVRRQVIVFTHDLHFLHCLKIGADKAAVTIQSHWIEQRDGIPGWVFVNNSPALEQDYKKTTRARKSLELAKAAPAEECEKHLHQGFGELRSTYEAFIIFDMFNEVVLRFNERLSFGRLKNVLVDQDMAKRVIERCEQLSGHIDGHLHSDQFVGAKPTPVDLQAAIDEFEALAKELKDKKKAAGMQ